MTAWSITKYEWAHLRDTHPVISELLIWVPLVVAFDVVLVYAFYLSLKAAQ